MYFHAELIIFEILNLYYTTTGNNEISTDILKEAFYTFISLVNKKEYISITYDFDSELEKLMDEDLLNESDGITTITNDLESFYIALVNKIGILTAIDMNLANHIHDTVMYDILGLEFNESETEEIFLLNRKIMSLYLLLALQEYQGNDQSLSIEKINDTLREFQVTLSSLDDETLTKVRIACSYYSSIHKLDGDDNYLNEDWNIALFSSDENQIKMLRYAQIMYLTSNCVEEDEKIKEEETADTLEVEFENDDLSTFLGNYFYLLNSYLLEYPNTMGREALIIKKYLLLSLPELNNISFYLFTNPDAIIEMPPIDKSDLTDESFEEVKPKAFECALEFFIKDGKANKDYSYSKLIIKALFIKNFLNLSINENSKKELINILINSPFYKNPLYQVCTYIIDEIILKNEKERTR